MQETWRNNACTCKTSFWGVSNHVLHFSCFYVLILIFLSCIPDTIWLTYWVYEGLPFSKICEQPKQDFASHFAGLHHSPNTGNVCHLDFALLSTGFIDIQPLFPGGVQIAFLQLVLLWSKQATNKKNGQVVLVCIILTRLPVDGFSSVLVTYHLTLVLSQSVTSVRSRSRRTNSLYNAARVTICIT